MMHWRVKRRLSAYLDDELTTDEANHLRIHLGTCVGCRHRFREIQAAESLLRRMPVSLLPEQWSCTAELRLRSAAGLPHRLRPDAANGMAFRAAAATLSMAIMLFVVTVGSLSVSPPEPPSSIGMLGSAERESSILASRYDPAGGWGRN
jgi:anti-sigma factor RsiW